MRVNSSGSPNLFFLFKRAHQKLTAHAARSVAEATGVPAAQVSALVHLVDSEGCSVNQLGDELGQGSAGMAGLVGRLEQDGLIRRRPSKQDRRKVELWLTPKGRRVAERVAPMLEALDAELRSMVKSADIASVERFLNAISQRYDVAGGE